MKKTKDSFDFYLKSSLLEYADGAGGTKIAKFLNLKAPSFRQVNQKMQLKQCFNQAMLACAKVIPKDDQSKEVKADTKEKMDGAAIMPILYMADIDITKTIDIFKNLLLESAYMDGSETKIPPHLLSNDSFATDDFENLLGEYIANFIV